METLPGQPLWVPQICRIRNPLTRVLRNGGVSPRRGTIWVVLWYWIHLPERAGLGGHVSPLCLCPPGMAKDKPWHDQWMDEWTQPSGSCLAFFHSQQNSGAQRRVLVKRGEPFGARPCRGRGPWVYPQGLQNAVEHLKKDLEGRRGKRR